MRTPICDFVEKYAECGKMRLHMPGHKGVSLFGAEKWDITEVDGADVLYSADGIIAESEKNATLLFGSGRTLYSTEGSSLCIRAMVYLLSLEAKQKGRKPLVWAARNAHKQGFIEKQWKRKSPNFFVIFAEMKLNRMQGLARNAANSLNLCAARVAAKQASRLNF